MAGGSPAPEEMRSQPYFWDGTEKRIASCDENGFLNVNLKSPLDPASGGVEVSVQDQTSELVDSIFARQVGEFTLAQDTVASGIDTLSYTFEATAGHGLIAGNEILLLDIIGDRALQAVVISVAVDTITIDRPIDHVYPAATSIARITISNMAVDGSVTPQIFTFRSGVAPVDITRILLNMYDDSSMDVTRFGGIAALQRGLVFRVVNGFHKTVFNFKTNGDIKRFCYDLDFDAKAPAGFYGATARITFGGQSKHGVVLRISGASVLQFIVQDNLLALAFLGAVAEGHKVVL